MTATTAKKKANGYKAIEKVITRVLKKHGLTPDTWGDFKFMRPEDWAARGEEYGKGSKLIAIFDGSPVYESLNYGFEVGWGLQEDLIKALSEIGVYYELMHAWSFAVYDS